MSIERLLREGAAHDVGRAPWLVFATLHAHRIQDATAKARSARTTEAIAKMLAAGRILSVMSQDEIADAGLVCKRWVQASVHVLENAGWIQAHRVSRQENVVYELGADGVLYADKVRAATRRLPLFADDLAIVEVREARRISPSIRRTL